ncbi:MAG: hypothetical protein CFH01_00810 [Alphaproteobacteria bacterium MarineAlpha2_Bin1]|nr:MAG: hypothetical protein CFH01_00810 [Alphaproteobacteria bacterium MarineAlpha2_Bin1]|tara:strand:+ start:583 stop:1485 length:903 start_codon:yes stop_codon:yes gene_type:complete
MKLDNILNILIYSCVVLIWGGAFLAIEYQLGVVPESTSIFLRYVAASIILFSLCIIIKKPMFNFPVKYHLLFFLVGLFFFSINYLLIYKAQNYLTSGTTAVAFAMCLFFSQINSKFFLGFKLKVKTSIGGIIGIFGIFLLFSSSIFSEQGEYNKLFGLSLILTAAYIVSLATIVTAKINLYKIPILQANSWAMIYGTIINFFLLIVTDSKIILDPRISYWISFSYLVIISSIIGFILYFLLVKRIGPEKSSYFAVMSPMIAVIISIFAENLQITFTLIGGVFFVLIGNYIAVKTKIDLNK